MDCPLNSHLTGPAPLTETNTQSPYLNQEVNHMQTFWEEKNNICERKFDFPRLDKTGFLDIPEYKGIGAPKAQY